MDGAPCHATSGAVRAPGAAAMRARVLCPSSCRILCLVSIRAPRTDAVHLPVAVGADAGRGSGRGPSGNEHPGCQGPAPGAALASTLLKRCGAHGRALAFDPLMHFLRAAPRFDDLLNRLTWLPDLARPHLLLIDSLRQVSRR